MIPRPVEAHAHVPVDLERSPGPWVPPGLGPTYVQLLLLCVALLFCVLLHVVRSLRLSTVDTSSTSPSCELTVEDKELCEPQQDDHSLEKSIQPSHSTTEPARGWWWVDALLGRDGGEDEATAAAARSMVIQTHQQLIWPVQNDPDVRGHKNPIPYYRPQQQKPPISMAKLIMSRHVRSSHFVFPTLRLIIFSTNSPGSSASTTTVTTETHCHHGDDNTATLTTPLPTSLVLCIKSYDHLRTPTLDCAPSVPPSSAFVLVFCPRGDCKPVWNRFAIFRSRSIISHCRYFIHYTFPGISLLTASVIPLITFGPVSILNFPRYSSVVTQWILLPLLFVRLFLFLRFSPYPFYSANDSVIFSSSPH